jgi:hypothetical protein
VNEISLINTTISLFQDAKQESEALYQEIGLRDRSINPFDEKIVDAFFRYEKASKPKNDKFKQFLESLLNSELALIEAVMYGGRDASSSGRAYPLEELLRQFEKDSKSSRVHSITEKASLDIYLTKGLGAYK